MAPLSVTGASAGGAVADTSFRRYMQMLMPVVSVFVAAVIVVMLLLVMSFKRRTPALSECSAGRAFLKRHLIELTDAN